MKKLFFILSLILTIAISADAQYVVHDFSGDVTIEKRGASTPVSKGMNLSGADVVNIPENGYIEIRSTADGSQLFRSLSAGKFSASRIAMDARVQASDNAKAIHDNIRGVAGSKKQQKVYDQTGMVTRSLIALDPAVAAMNITQENLCQCLAGAIRNDDFLSRSAMPVELTHESGPTGGMKVNIRSDYSYPVYFNIFKFKPGSPRVEVSELGQDIGNYMLGSNQIISREQTSPLEEGYTHVVLMTPAPFNLNGLLKDLEEMLTHADIATPSAELPIYIKALR